MEHKLMLLKELLHMWIVAGEAVIFAFLLGLAFIGMKGFPREENRDS
jgi:hypothetical protein